MARSLLTLLLVLSAVSLVGVGQAQAIDLNNEDQRAWKVQVTSRTMSKTIALSPRTGAIVVCVGVCRFTGRGLGAVTANSDDVVSIRAGRLVVEGAALPTASVESTPAPRRPPAPPAARPAPSPEPPQPRVLWRALGGTPMRWLP